MLRCPLLGKEIFVDEDVAVTVEEGTGLTFDVR